MGKGVELVGTVVSCIDCRTAIVEVSVLRTVRKYLKRVLRRKKYCVDIDVDQVLESGKKVTIRSLGRRLSRRKTHRVTKVW